MKLLYESPEFVEPANTAEDVLELNVLLRNEPNKMICKIVNVLLNSSKSAQQKIKHELNHTPRLNANKASLS